MLTGGGGRFSARARSPLQREKIHEQHAPARLFHERNGHVDYGVEHDGFMRQRGDQRDHLQGGAVCPAPDEKRRPGVS